MTKVAVSILDADFSDLKKVVKTVEKSRADWVHIDTMDGNFVPNLSFGAPVVKSIRPLTDKIIDVHLMCSRPSVLIEPFVAAGADYITVHIECNEDMMDLISKIKKHKKKVGISIKPGTKVAKLIPYLPMVDLVLVMSVEPGFGGQSFQKTAIDRIAELKDLIGKRSSRRAKKGASQDDKQGRVLIQVDGGINDVNAPAVVAAGVDVLAVGSYFWKAKDKVKAVQKLKKN